MPAIPSASVAEIVSDHKPWRGRGLGPSNLTASMRVRWRDFCNGSLAAFGAAFGLSAIAPIATEAALVTPQNVGTDGSSTPASHVTPGPAADVHQELDLERLNVGRDLARHDGELRHRRAGKAALRADAEPLHGCKARRFVDAAH